MKKKNYRKYLPTLAAITVMLCIGRDLSAQGLTLEQFLAQSIPQSSNMIIARLREEQALLQKDSIASSMGWQASGSVGASHDVSLFGSPSDRIDLSGRFERKLESGSSLGVTGTYSYDNEKVNLISSLPNPSQGLNVDLFYRVPLKRGSDGADIRQGLLSADAGVKISAAQKLSQQQALAKQLIDLYFNAVQMQTQIAAANDQILRVQRLREFTERNLHLGLSEKRDLYQIQAQEETAIASRRDLAVSWNSMQTEMNRLLKHAADNQLNLADLGDNKFDKVPDFSQALSDVMKYSPERKLQLSQLSMSDAQLQIQRDNNKNTLDMLMSVGSRTRTGTLQSGTLNESDYAAKISLEYRIAMDKRGMDAGITRAMQDRTIAEEQLKDVESNLKYEVNTLYQSITEMEKAITHYRYRLDKEHEKYEEGMREYRAGRVATNLIVQFENDLQAADVALKSRLNELAKNRAKLQLLRGQYASLFQE